MHPSLNIITEHLRACANCGRGTFLRTSSIDLYCDNCWVSLLKNSSVTAAHDYPFKVSSLLVWNNFTPQVENLIYSLKGGGLKSAFVKIAEHFAIHLNCQRNRDQVLVVPPSRRPLESDHAWAWGCALSEVLGLKLLSPFEFATEAEAKGTDRLLALAPQKRLKVNERFERQFKLKEGTCLKSSSVVFVDDLITSGATALAAYKAVNSPVDFEVWAIARRPKLAGI